MLLLLLYNHRTDNTENIFGSIAEKCLQRRCLETVATLRYASVAGSLPSNALSSTLQ
jgi:hypothetical protein